MKFGRQIKGPYVCFRPVGEFSAGQIVKLKTAITDDLKDTKKDIAIDMRKITFMDVTGLRFIKNLKTVLAKEERSVVVFGGSDEIVEELKNSNIKVFETQTEFEQGFHEMSVQSIKYYLELAKGNAAIKNLLLMCPICGYENVKGFMLNEEMHQLCWEDEQITPRWRYTGESENDIDFDLYTVAVCPECWFASSRVDWFEMNVEEGHVESKLTKSQIDRIANYSAHRKEIAAEIPDISTPTYFAMPREKLAAYGAWRLNELTFRTVHKEKSDLDGYEIAYSNFMMCKFADDPDIIDRQLNTAQAWLLSIVENKERYSTFRVVKAYTFAISVLLYMDKYREALKMMQQFESEFHGDDEYKLWLLRAKELLEAER